ncbi:MAG: hypothetical protein ABFC89_00260, partial [Methanospirillum sp.]
LVVRTLTIRTAAAEEIVLCSSSGTPGITLEPGDVRRYAAPGGDRVLLELWATSASGAAVLEVEEARFPVAAPAPARTWRRPVYLVTREIGAGSSTVMTHSAQPSPVAPRRLPTPLPPPVYVLDEQRNPIALLDGYRFLSWTQRYRSPDDWIVSIPKSLPNATALLTGTFIAVPIAGALRVGEIEVREAGLDEGGSATENIEASGRCYGKWFEERTCIYKAEEGDGYDVWRTSSGSAAEAMVHFVRENCLTAGGSNRRPEARIVPDLAIGTYPATDARVGIAGRFQTVAEVLSEISAVSGLGWEVVYDQAAKVFRFNVLGGCPRLDVLLSPALGNVRMLRYSASTRGDRTVGVLAGQGEGASRQLAMSCTAARFPGYTQPTGRTWREIFIDASDCKTNQDLSDRLDAKLAEYGDGVEESFAFEILGEGPNAPTDLRLGDVVQAEYPEVAAQVARVIARTEAWDENGHHTAIEVGKEAPDLFRTINLANRRLAGQTRL